MDRKVREQDFTVNRKVKASCMSVPECWEVAGGGVSRFRSGPTKWQEQTLEEDRKVEKGKVARLTSTK